MNNVASKLSEDRAFFNTLGNFYPADITVDITNENVAGVECYWFEPENFEEDKLIVYLHGGSFVLGSIQSHKPMVSYFASTLSARILFVDYGLAPEKPFPNGVNDLLKVYRALIHTYPDTKISIIADSAGGGLTVSFLDMAMKEKLPLPLTVVFISPFIYIKCNTGSHKTRKEADKVLTTEALKTYVNYYVDDKWNEADPSELKFTSFPPLFILVGTNEILYDDSKYFYEKIKPLQPVTKMKEYKDQGHVWLITDIKSEASQNALADIKEFISPFLGLLRPLQI